MFTSAAFVLFLTGGGASAQQDGMSSSPLDTIGFVTEMPLLTDAEGQGVETIEGAPPDGPGDAATDAPATDADGLSASLPRCDTLAPGATGPTDCTIDDAGTILTFAYSGTPDAARLIVTQSAPEGGERRVSDPIRISGATMAPQLTDKDEDGDFELWLPVGAVGDETIFELWLADADYFFTRRDEVIALSPDAIVPRGELLVLTSPDADDPGKRTETSMFLDPTGLTEIYRVGINDTARTCTLLGPNTGATSGATSGTTLNAALIEADCADRLGFPAPVAPGPLPLPLTPDISPKEI